MPDYQFFPVRNLKSGEILQAGIMPVPQNSVFNDGFSVLDIGTTGVAYSVSRDGKKIFGGWHIVPTDTTPKDALQIALQNSFEVLDPA